MVQIMVSRPEADGIIADRVANLRIFFAKYFAVRNILTNLAVLIPGSP